MERRGGIAHAQRQISEDLVSDANATENISSRGSWLKRASIGVGQSEKGCALRGKFRGWHYLSWVGAEHSNGPPRA